MSEQSVILLVEDREDDVVLVRRALSRGFLDNPMHVVRSGEEAISYLQGEGKYSNRAEYPLPDLVLLDLKMPGMDGFGVLEWIRNQEGLRGMRVVVLTSSEQMRDVNRAYQLGANSFLVKPTDFDDYIHVTRVLREYWLTLDRAPDVSRREKGVFKPKEEK